MSKNNLEPIAVIGIGAIMPGALSKDEFWKNITEGKNSIIEVPQDRWDYRLFYSEDRSAPDKTYTKIGGFITGFKFNSLKYRIPPSVAKQMDSIQHLALEIASMALEDSGYDKKDFDRSRTAVIIANAMGGIKNEYSNTRIYKAFYYDMLRHSAHFAALPPAQQEAIIEDVEASVNAKFLPITEDSMPGELPNVISGRVANVFNLNGTSFSIDAACASSIAALDQAVNGLRMGNYDMALCGGVDQMMSPAAYIKFCKIGALSADGSFAFDARANGFVMAEGAGMVVLKRLSDAERDGDKIYGVIRAIGASSDGKGKGITAPNPKGQKLAIENTFKQLDYTPGEVGLMEAHGTATKVGDATELAALDEVFKPYAPAGSIGLGSIKSQIGHAKAAAGIASVIKVMLALHNKVLPPSINFETPNPIVDWASTPFKVITQARPWNTDKIRRANVSSFGFGGTNFHLAAEEYNPALSAKKAVPSATSENQENKTMSQTQNTANKYELLVPMEKLQGDMLVFSGESKQDLFNELNQAVQSIQGDPLYLIKAAYKNHTASYKQYAVSINAESPAKLKEKIEFFIKTASSSDVWAESSLYLKMKGIYPFYNHSEKPKVCFMFPGQGSQYVDMMKDLASKYKVVRDTFAEADVILKEIAGTTLTDVIWSKEGESKEEYKKREEGIKQTQITQPAILTANVAMMRLLYQFGIKPDVTMGHSLGEYGAAVAAGVLSFPDAIRAVTTRGTAMANIKVPDCGKMAAIAASVDKIEPELKKISGYVAVANKNCPTQTVIAGESKSVDDAVALFTSMGIQSVLVPVSHAFHSAIVRPASSVYREFLNGLTINAPKLPITSNVSADFYPSDPSKIRDMMVEQIMSSVEWIKQVELAYARGVRLFIEVGPKRVLSAFVTSTLSDKKDIRVLASNHPKRGGITEFNDLMANLAAAGIWIDWSKTDMNKEETIFNPAFVAAAGFKAPAQEAVPSVCACAAPAKNSSEVQVAISGIAAGTPGSWEKVFREGNLDEILQGKNFIENISVSEQERQIEKNIEYVVKSRVGNHRVEKLTDVSQSVKLAAKKGEFDLEKEFGVPAKWVKSMDPSFTLAIAAGILALKDAGIPLVLYYKPTTAGTYLPDRWGLPQSMIDDTGVIFTSAFPTVNSWAFEVSTKVADALIGKTKKQVRAFYEHIINSITDEVLKAQIKVWFEENFAEYENHNARVFSQDFLLKAIPIAHSQFCQWIRARGPATHLSGACASTAQAISVAEDWIKLGRAKRVIIIAADDVTNNVIQEWILAGFLASGAVSREADVTKAALPFDRRRNGMIVGMGAAGLVVEAEEEIRKRGMTPLTRLLATEITNSAFHPTRIDVNHVAEVMDRMMSKAEKKYGLNRSDMSKEMVFISHETYTPARGGSASAEVFALKNTFKGDVENVIVSNTKGFTGHSMGAGLEDVIAVHSLNTGNVPPIANYKEPDPELAGINLSKGGHYNFKYALRLAAGFGSQLSMTLQEKTWSEGEPRIIDQTKYMNWLKEASNQEAPVLEVVNNTLRIKDNYQAGKKPALVMEASQAFVDKAAAGHLRAQAEAPAVSAPAAQPAPVAAPVAAPAKKLDEATVTEEIVNLISEKTGYPKDMLELDLDMEADLGIDTVKQAELFAAMREMYNLPQAEGIQLKDYPTIRHCINYALSTSNNAGNATVAAAPVQTVQAAPVTPAVSNPVASAAQPAPVAAPAAAPAKKLDEATVTEEIVNLISEKTGYPKDMLELDLDMEADLGIDTVKQAELFAAMREMYNLPQAEGIQLKDYPTIRHCINYALNASSGAAVPAAQPVQTVQANAPVTPAPVTVQPAVAPVVPTGSAPAAQPAPVAAPAAAPAKKLDEATVTEEIVNLIAEKTGYPKDMLELDLDMEADLGIDTVKQAELFAAMREMYNLPQAEGIQLKDYPTIRHCINYALNAASGAAAPAAQPVQTVQVSAPATPAPVTVQPAAAPVVSAVSAPAAQPAPVVAPAPAPVQAAPAAQASSQPLDEAKVTEEIVNLIAEKTGYPKDMLELDLDMEADLGIDTVKQAELFAAMREMYNLPQAEGIQLKDYPTIRHCINYALNASKAPAAQPAEAAPSAQQPASAEQNTAAAQPAAEAVPAVTEPKHYEGEDSHNKKLRFIPTLVDAPLASEANRRLSADRTVLIFSDSAALTRAYVDSFKALGVKTHIFTTLKTRSKNTTIVNWDSLEETTAALEQYAKENPGAVQGIVYLLPCSIKKFDKKINPHADLTKFLMPLFMACKVFVKDMSKRDDADTFLSVVFKVDGAFAYKTKEAISPTIGSVCGAANCLRKDFYQIGGVFSKIMDFEPSAEPEYMAEKTIHELLKGDDRGMVSYYEGRRSTLFSVPRKLNMSKKHMDLTGKTVAFTGAGRGLGSILSQKLASQYKARVLILDIIELTDKTPYWATLNEAELKELKQKMWLEMKADTSVRATPVMLERAFGKVKDSITLYKNMQKIKALGGDVDYYQCDVTNGSMLKDVVTRIKAKYGKVDGLIHFAGFERSKLFTDKTTDEYYRTFDIKATSAAAFVALNFVKDTGFYAFASSIAGKYGNLGQSDYASANDFLAKLCISLHNQGQRAISIDMSAYANVGMGVRPGVVEFLTSHGVKFVDPYDGMQIFLNEIVYGRVPEIVLTDDLGELDLDGQIRINDPFILEEDSEEGGNTPSGGNGGDNGGEGASSAPVQTPAQESVKQPEGETENFFLGEVKNLSAGKEIEAENTFNAEYPFLFDHAIEGTPYVPGVMGIETFVETASMLEGKTPQGLEDVHFYLPIKLLRRRPQTVRIKGVEEAGKVSMEIESDFINSKGIKMGNTRRHFTARVLEHFESKWNLYKNKVNLEASSLAVTKEEIYTKFFHGPSFQVLGGILKIDENAVLGVYEKPSQVLFHDGPKHLLAYPMLIEACFQTCGYRDLAVENRMTLPDSIGKVYIHGKGEAPNKLYTLAVFTGKNIEGKSIYDGFVFDEKGKLWIELSDYQMIGQ
ncbi:MAG: SDR family NAD(P)-dependent oxidoreductase [Elusimicrobia bacterium]|nr:SDR family NAD(P)-dependent oxidoreductase [Elusimicrobiota bacterium]